MVIINEGVQKIPKREQGERASERTRRRSSIKQAHKCPLIYYQNRIIGHLTL